MMVGVTIDFHSIIMLHQEIYPSHIIKESLVIKLQDKIITAKLLLLKEISK